MPVKKSPRKGSLQFWPRKRAKKFLPRVNWNVINSDKTLKGFIGYKAGMFSISVKDNTPDSLTKGKTITVPATLIECPPIKVFAIRFYKNGKVVDQITTQNIDKEIKRKIKVAKKGVEKKFEEIKEHDDIRVLVYSQVKKTKIKKTPDLIEVGLSGSLDEKTNFAKENLGKEISLQSVFELGELADVKGLTKGKGLSGPVKRFGITLKSHKSEKGRRRPGSLGPWHPARVTFRVPQAGQLGMFTRTIYNNKIMGIGNAKDTPLNGVKNFGDIKTDYLLIRGSIQGAIKRQLILTHSLRPTKKQLKKNFELIKIIR
jgi:large subunit ribosomal protein L3